MFFFTQSSRLQTNYPTLFSSVPNGKTSPGQAQRIRVYNEATKGGEWFLFWYALADWDLLATTALGKKTIGEVFQFAVFRRLKEELDQDLEKIAYEDSKRK